MGFRAAVAQRRLQQYGPNQLAEKKKEPGWQALRLNAIGYFRKPVDGTALLDAIDWAMQISSREKVTIRRTAMKAVKEIPQEKHRR